MEKTSRGSPEYRIENLKDRTAIHCPVESEYKQVLHCWKKLITDGELIIR